MGGTNKDAVSLDFSSLNGGGDNAVNGIEEKLVMPSVEEVKLTIALSKNQIVKLVFEGAVLVVIV